MAKCHVPSFNVAAASFLTVHDNVGGRTMSKSLLGFLRLTKREDQSKNGDRTVAL